jgi:tyrosinase
MPEGQGTFTIPPGNQDTMNTLLEPFSPNGRGQFYTSSSAWKMSTFGYTYPEIQDWNQTPEQLQSNVTAAINIMYNPQGTQGKRAAMPGGQTKEWSVGLSVSEYDLQGKRFIIRVFLGAIPGNPEDWPINNGCARSFTVFPPPHAGDGPYPTIMAYDEIGLTKGLSENGMDATDVEAVEKWLSSNLSWRVQKVSTINA